MEGLVLGLSLPFLLFGLGCIIARIINGPPSGGNALQAVQWDEWENEPWQHKSHKFEPIEITPDRIRDPYWDSRNNFHGPGPNQHGPGPHYG